VKKEELEREIEHCPLKAEIKGLRGSSATWSMLKERNTSKARPWKKRDRTA